MPEWFKSVAALIVVFAVPIFGIRSCVNSDWYQDIEKERHAKEKAQSEWEQTPRVIREVDGCKVYTFKSVGNWHFFTRCAAQTSTDTANTYTVRNGKQTTTKTDISTIVTENK